MPRSLLSLLASVRLQMVNEETRKPVGEWPAQRVKVGEHLDVTTLTLAWQVTV